MVADVVSRTYVERTCRASTSNLKDFWSITIGDLMDGRIGRRDQGGAGLGGASRFDRTRGSLAAHPSGTIGMSDGPKIKLGDADEIVGVARVKR